uniref:Conserved secreted protein n=1 Tax=Steinernema glaseri TaxID=37863 RepID=A0A1I8AL44_9BILA
MRIYLFSLCFTELCASVLLSPQSKVFQVSRELLRHRRSSVSSACFSGDTSPVDAARVPEIPSRYNVDTPWNRPDVRVYESDTLRFNWNWMKALPVRGLNDTVADAILE